MWLSTRFAVSRRSTGSCSAGPGESNPVTASSLLINAYVGDLERSAAAGPKVGWDFDDEMPGNDARGLAAAAGAPPEVETHLVNAVLTNGARYYVDHAHPELSTPECADARSVVVWDRAAEQILIRSMEAAHRMLPDGQEIVVHKNNSDGKGNSYGCHENYLMDRSVPFGRIVHTRDLSLRHPPIVHRSGKDRFRGAGHVGRRCAVSVDATCGLLRGRGRPGDDAEATDHQHPRRAPCRCAEVPPAPRDHR